MYCSLFMGLMMDDLLQAYSIAKIPAAWAGISLLMF